MSSNKMEQSLSMVDQLIEFEKARDKDWVNMLVTLHRSSEIVGESIMLLHLRNLKELIVKESSEPPVYQNRT